MTSISNAQSIIKWPFFNSGWVNILTIVLVAVILSYPSLNLWWHNLDSVHILLQAHHFGPLSYFTDPATYQLLTSANLTPWVILSFDIDHSIFGVNPVGFHIHQMVDISLVGISVYMLSRLWADRLTSLFCALALVTMIPVAISAVALPHRHYLEGMILATISLYSLLRSEESYTRSSRLWLLLSIICFGLALTAKEVFAPLVVVLFFISRRPVTERIIRLLGHIVLIMLYCGWRYYMLGQLIGGYEDAARGALNLSVVFKDILFIFSSLPRAVSFSAPGSWAVLILFMVVLAAGSATRSIRWPLAAIILVCTIAPVIPVAWVIQMYGVDNTVRYFMVITWIIVIGLSVLIPKLSSRWMRHAAVGVLACATALNANASYETISKRSNPDEFSLPSCYRFVWSKGSDSLLITSGLFTKDGLAALAHLKTLYTGAGPAIYAGDIALPENFRNSSVYVQSNIIPECFMLKPARKKAIIQQAENARVDDSSTIEVRWLQSGVEWEIGAAEWELAGQNKGRFFLTITDGKASYRRRIKEQKGQFLSIPIQRQLFIYGVHTPATMSIEQIIPNKGVVYSRPAPVPDFVFDYWQYASSEKVDH